MSNKVMELKPVMTKAKALELIIGYVEVKGIPEMDAVVYTRSDADGVNQWTFRGLCKLLIDEL